MTKNRRFPFERTKEKISLEDFSTTNKQLYPMIRQYLSISRYNNNYEKPRCIQQDIVSNQENNQLNELINHLKQENNNNNSNVVDINNISSLRQHNIQHWKHVKNEWQKYYHDQIKKEQEIFDNLIKNFT